MGFPTLEVGYTSATTGRGDHEVHKGHVVALGEKNNSYTRKASVSVFAITVEKIFVAPAVDLHPVYIRHFV
jgi:hypothetical protein